MSQRDYGRYVPRLQAFAQGQNSTRNATTKNIRQTRQIQPGNTFWKTVRSGHPDLST